MIDIKDISRAYFIGIGGIGMSALARYFKTQGKLVSGYDRTRTELTKQLEEEGIAVHYSDSVDQAPKDAGLVVYTPAIPKDFGELVYFQEMGYPVWKRSDVLGAITNSSFNICVAGTHGKTTISTMIAHILRDSDYGCNAFLGGISVNYGSNFWSNKRNVCVVEADEYDRSFLKLHPDVAVISAMDADHLDIYGTAEAVEQAFIDFSGKVKQGGMLLTKWGLKRQGEFVAKEHRTYSLMNPASDIHTLNIRIVSGRYEFDVRMGAWTLGNVQLNMGGLHNVENVTAAIAVAHHLGIEDSRIRKAVGDFKGVKRRFEYIIRSESSIKAGSKVYIDDYAHHPEELKALISSAKELFPALKCTIIFQPHLFSRTRDFAAGFAQSLDLADSVVLLPIYPARELPIEGVSSRLIFENMRCPDKQIIGKGEVLNWIKINPPQLLITAGAGDIDNLVGPIKDVLERMN